MAATVARTEKYNWSSYLENAWGRTSDLVTHEEYLNPGSNVESRCFAYRELFKHQLSEHDIHLIERASEYSYPTGDDRFYQQIVQR